MDGHSAVVDGDSRKGIDAVRAASEAAERIFRKKADQIGGPNRMDPYRVPQSVRRSGGEMAEGDHDGFFKDVFRRPAEASGLLRATVPGPLAAALVWERLESLGGETAESEGGGHRRDLVFRVPFRAGALGPGTPEALEVLVLLEHKSRPAPDLPLTLLGYMVRTWEDQRKRGDRLAPIVPVVVYHGARRWKVPLDFGSWLVPAPGARALLSAVIPDFRYLLDGRRPPVPALYPGTALARLARFLLDHARSGRLWEYLGEWRAELVELLASGDPADNWHGLFAILYYLAKTATGGDEETARVMLLEAAGEEVSAMGSWGVEGLKALYREQGHKEGRLEGRQEGRLEGRQEGRQEGLHEGRLKGQVEGRQEGRLEGRREGLHEGRLKGQVEGHRTLLAELLVERFGPLSEDASARLATADLDALKRWSRRLVRAETLSEVFKA
jgi:hypothetical protein